MLGRYGLISAKGLCRCRASSSPSWVQMFRSHPILRPSFPRGQQLPDSSGPARISSLSAYQVCSAHPDPLVATKSQTTITGSTRSGPRLPAQLDQNVCPPMRSTWIGWNTVFGPDSDWKLDVSSFLVFYCLARRSGSSLKTRAKDMSMPSNGLSLSQWDSLYVN